MPEEKKAKARRGTINKMQQVRQQVTQQRVKEKAKEVA
jgi:hypothetical protein